MADFKKNPKPQLKDSRACVYKTAYIIPILREKAESRGKKGECSVNAKYYLLFVFIVSVLFFNAVTSYSSELDDAIELSAKNSYTFKTYLKDDAIKVESEDGVVTLTGAVADAYHKLLATDTVSNLPGVKSVDDRLEIAGKAPAEYSDEWLSMKVKAVLLFHFNLNPFTKVYVNEGIVTLQGEADSQAQKELTAEYIEDVEGVRGVKNEMRVAGAAQKPAGTLSEKIDDASITAQVKLALLAHRSTGAFKTHVRTEKGVVTLTGNAKTGAEKELVTKLVSDIKGVKKVVNDMTVK